jgi:hypothetical protein
VRSRCVQSSLIHFSCLFPAFAGGSTYCGPPACFVSYAGGAPSALCIGEMPAMQGLAFASVRLAEGERRRWRPRCPCGRLPDIPDGVLSSDFKIKLSGGFTEVPDQGRTYAPARRGRSQ